MKKIIGLFLALAICLPVSARQKTKTNRKALVQAVAALTAKIDSLQGVVDALERKCVPVRKEIDPAWEKWQDVRYNYGFDPEEQPVYNTVDGILESTTMLSVRGGRGRWHNKAAKPRTSFVDGGHLFEGWNGTETCRLTMLIGKQAPDIACIQVYSRPGTSDGSNSAPTTGTKAWISAAAGPCRSCRSPWPRWTTPRPTPRMRMRS